MAWQAYYDDLSIFSSKETSDPNDLPINGIQAVKVDGKPFIADIFGWEEDEVFISNASFASVKLQRPNAILREGRTCSTRRFHEIEIEIGLWSSKNTKPDILEPNWKKDIVGWRLWTAIDVFDSKGIPEGDWLAYWVSLPATDIQVVVLYENWRTKGGVQYRQMQMGNDFFFMSPTEFGPVFHSSDNKDIAEKYPGAVIKTGSLLPEAEFNIIRDIAIASVEF